MRVQMRHVWYAILHSDCSLAVQAIHGTLEDFSSLDNLIEDMKVLCLAHPGISVSHALRTTNFVAHRLAC